MYAFSQDQAGVDGVHANLASTQFLGEDGGDGVNGGLGGGVHRSVRRQQGADARTDVDDAAAFGADEFHGFLGGEQQAEYVEIKMAVEEFLGDLTQWCELINPRVVHQNIEFSVGFLG